MRLFVFTSALPCKHPVSRAQAHFIPPALTSCLDALLPQLWFQSPEQLCTTVYELSSLHLGPETHSGPISPTPCRVPLHLIWTLILHTGPSPLTLTTYRPPNSSSTELSCKGKGKRQGGSERALARRNRCGGSIVDTVIMDEIIHFLQLVVVYPLLYGHWPQCSGPVPGWKHP